MAARRVSPLKVRALTPRQRHAIGERDGWTCVECGLDGVAARDEIRAALRTVIRSTTWRCTSGDDRLRVLAGECGHALPVVRAVVSQHRVPIDVDHVIPRALGGTNDPANLRCLCCACHQSKSSDDAGAIARTPSTMRSRDAGS